MRTLRFIALLACLLLPLIVLGCIMNPTAMLGGLSMTLYIAFWVFLLYVAWWVLVYVVIFISYVLKSFLKFLWDLAE